MVARPAIRLAAKPQLPPTLKTVTVDPASLVRVSGHDTGEPYFGRWGTNRFDDPNPDAASRYGTCYLGASLAVAVAETVLHDRKPIKSWFVVELAVIKRLYVVLFAGSPLVLADLTGAELKRAGGHAALTGACSYKTTRKWSAAVHAHLDLVDGFLYMSRHKNDEKAVVLFDRAAHKVKVKDAGFLHKHPGFGQVATELYIRSSSP